MQIALGIVLVLLFTLATKQIWDIYNRELLLEELITSQQQAEKAMTSATFLSEQASELELYLQDLVKNEKHSLRMELFTKLDKKATRKVYIIWICISAIIAFGIFRIGVIYLWVALALGLLNRKSKPPTAAVKNALQQYRLILRTLIHWAIVDEQELLAWLADNSKYKNMVIGIKKHLIDMVV